MTDKFATDVPLIFKRLRFGNPDTGEISCMGVPAILRYSSDVRASMPTRFVIGVLETPTSVDFGDVSPDYSDDRD
jgi:hypothetical protein